MSDLLTRVYLLFCKIGLHQWIYGEGYVALSKDVSFEHNGYRCVWCGKCKTLRGARMPHDAGGKPKC